jgi:hypothetical protein
MRTRKSAILREPVDTVDVRVCPGHALKVRNELAPTVDEYFTEGEVIEALDADHALTLIFAGVVEAVDA